MKKLYFRYGAMGGAKSLNLIAVATNYALQDKQVRVFTALPWNMPHDPAPPCRIESRMDVAYDCDPIFWDTDWSHERRRLSGVACILVDEAHFLNADGVDQLRQISMVEDIPIICYGLRTDWKGNLFDGSKRLMEVADSIEEVKTVCSKCSRKATMNKKLVNGEEVIALEKDIYLPTCYFCWEHS